MSITSKVQRKTGNNCGASNLSKPHNPYPNKILQTHKEVEGEAHQRDDELASCLISVLQKQKSFLNV